MKNGSITKRTLCALLAALLLTSTLTLASCGFERFETKYLTMWQAVVK